MRYMHDPRNPQSIDQVTRIAALYEDSRGYLWVRHFDGRLDRFDPEKGVFKRFRHDSDEPDAAAVSASPGHDNVSFVREDRNGDLWWEALAAASTGSIRCRSSSSTTAMRPMTPRASVTTSFCRSMKIALGNSGSAPSYGLNRFDPAQLNFPAIASIRKRLTTAENNVVLDVRGDRAGLIWVGSTVGLSSLDRTAGQVTRYRHNPEGPDSLSAGRVWSTFEDAHGRLWVGTESSLDRLDRSTGQFAHFKNTPDDASAGYGVVAAITEDRRGWPVAGCVRPGVGAL